VWTAARAAKSSIDGTWPLVSVLLMPLAAKMMRTCSASCVSVSVSQDVGKSQPIHSSHPNNDKSGDGTSRSVKQLVSSSVVNGSGKRRESLA
jgi:hypothetical protein